MDRNKLMMLKANVKRNDYISINDIKGQYNVDDDEAQELLDDLIQGGLVQPWPIDGVHFKVNK